jgi:hypothetical protein
METLIWRRRLLWSPYCSIVCFCSVILIIVFVALLYFLFGHYVRLSNYGLWLPLCIFIILLQIGNTPSTHFCFWRKGIISNLLQYNTTKTNDRAIWTSLNNEGIRMCFGLVNTNNIDTVKRLNRRGHHNK